MPRDLRAGLDWLAAVASFFLSCHLVYYARGWSCPVKFYFGPTLRVYYCLFPGLQCNFCRYLVEYIWVDIPPTHCLFFFFPSLLDVVPFSSTIVSPFRHCPVWFLSFFRLLLFAPSRLSPLPPGVEFLDCLVATIGHCIPFLRPF